MKILILCLIKLFLATILLQGIILSTNADDSEDYAPDVCTADDGSCDQQTENEVSTTPENEVLEAIKVYGLAQQVEGPDAKRTLQVIKSSLEYMNNLSDSNKECRNLDKNCALLAAIGECEENCSFMKENCGPSCHKCDSDCAVPSPKPRLINPTSEEKEEFEDEDYYEEDYEYDDEEYDDDYEEDEY